MNSTPELPEIAILARDMQKEPAGRTISVIEVLQPKCLNLPEDEFQDALTDAQILAVTSRGKWLLVNTSKGWLLLNLGMSGEILLTDRDHLPEKYRLIFDLDDGAACPACGTPLAKIRTGSTASYICPGCQRLEPANRLG